MTPNQITAIVFAWIAIGIFVDHKRNHYNDATMERIGLVEDGSIRWFAFIFAPINFAYILIVKFAKTIFIEKW